MQRLEVSCAVRDIYIYIYIYIYITLVVCPLSQLHCCKQNLNYYNYLNKDIALNS